MKNIRYYVFFALDFLKGGRIRKNYKEIKRLTETGETEKWQKEKIDILIKKAYNDCEYYRNYREYKKIDECPVINKAIIKENYDDMISKKYNRNTLHKMSTSGSTGTPFEILQNREKRERVLAELIYFNEIAGQYVGDKFIFFRVWTEKNKKSFFERKKQNLIPIDILHFDEDNMRYIVSYLENKKGIKSTLAYASTYDAILKYIKDNEINGKFNVRSMISSSEVLSDETRKGIEKYIGCHVINRYSNQENGVLAQSDFENEDLMVNNAGYYVELLKLENDEPAEEGELGRIVITDLFNYAMPLIRYDTGDLGISNNSGNIKTLKSIQGRRVDIIYDTKGRPLTPHTWSVYMWKYDKLKQYQFIQEDEKKYILKVNGAEGIYTKEDFDETLRSILGMDAEITIEYVDEIPVLSSGKFKKTICNYKPYN